MPLFLCSHRSAFPMRHVSMLGHNRVYQGPCWRQIPYCFLVEFSYITFTYEITATESGMKHSKLVDGWGQCWTSEAYSILFQLLAKRAPTLVTEFEPCQNYPNTDACICTTNKSWESLGRLETPYLRLKHSTLLSNTSTSVSKNV